MADDPVLVTDQDALEQVGEGIGESYLAADGRVVSGDKVAETIASGLTNTDQLGNEESYTGVLGIADKLGTLFMEYKLVGMLTKPNKSFGRKVLTFGAVGALQLFNVLPASMHPLLDAVGSVIGGDTGNAMKDFADYLPATTDTSILTDALAEIPDGISTLKGEDPVEKPPSGITEGDDFAERDEGDATMATAEARVKAIYMGQFGEDMMSSGAGKNSLEDVKTYMSANGKLMAEDGVFASCANKDITDREFAGMRTMTASACELLESGMSGDGSVTVSRKDCAETYRKLIEGLAAYESGAREGFDSIYADDPEKRAQAEAGLAKVMDASRGPVIESLRRIQDEYGLFTEEEMEQFGELLPGLNDDGLEAAIEDSYEDSDLYAPDDATLAALTERAADVGVQAEQPVVSAEPVTVDTEPDVSTDAQIIQADADSAELAAPVRANTYARGQEPWLQVGDPDSDRADPGYGI